MSQIKNIFQNQQAFVGYITGGDGGIDYGVDCALKLIEGGINILEIGLPFSDPIADGLVIQKAASRALEQGINAEAILEMANRIKKNAAVPLILFTYFNPLLVKGESFLSRIKEAGFDGILIIDLPPLCKEGNEYLQLIKEAGLDPIVLIAPSTEEDRLIELLNQAQGFIYYACQKGTTGARERLPEDFAVQIQRIRKHTNLPIVAGFGIANYDSAFSCLQHADGFVVGSAFVQQMENKIHPEQLKSLAQSIDPRQRSVYA